MKKITKENILMILVLFLALVLRLISINQSLWLDEATSAIAAKMGIEQMLTQFTPGDFHPPLYYLLLKVWSFMFGYSEVGLRSLSIFAGVLSVLVLYKITQNLKIGNGKWKIPEVAALLLATSGLHIYFSQEARMYVLASFFVVLEVLFFVKTLRVEEGIKSRNKSNIVWLIFSLSLALTFLTHYLTILMVGVFWFYSLLYLKNPNWWKKFIASHIILLISIVLWFPILTKQLNLGLGVEGSVPVWWQVLGKTNLKEIVLVPTKFILGRITFVNKNLYGFVAVGLSLFYGWIIVRPSLKEAPLKYAKLVWLWLIVPFLLAALIGIKVSIFSYNRLLFILPALYLLLARGIGNLPTGWRKCALGLIVSVNIFSSLFYLLNTRFHREDWRSMVRFVEDRKQNENSITLFVADSQMEAYKFYDTDAKISGPKGLNHDYDQIWLMRYVQPIFDPQDKLREEIENSGYEKVGEYDFNGVVVWKYER